MTQEEAQAEAQKREKSKSKHLTHKKWAAQHNSVKGWHVMLIDAPRHVYQNAVKNAKDAFLNDDREGFFAATEDLLLAKCQIITDEYEGQHEIPISKDP